MTLILEPLNPLKYLFIMKPAKILTHLAFNANIISLWSRPTIEHIRKKNDKDITLRCQFQYFCARLAYFDLSHKNFASFTILLFFFLSEVYELLTLTAMRCFFHKCSLQDCLLMPTNSLSTRVEKTLDWFQLGTVKHEHNKHIWA